jgi:colanic acid/amylovoran biosynthesis glycosyltransferase
VNNPVPISIYVKNFLPGSETFIYRQLKGIMPEYSPIIICKQRKNSDIFPFEPIFCREDILEKTVYQARRFLIGYNDKATKQNYKFCENALTEHKAKLIHSHFGPNGITILPLAKKLDIPLIVTFHGYDIALARSGQKKYKKQLRSLFEYAGRIITVSRKMKEEIISMGTPGDKVTAHYIGVSPETFRIKNYIKANNRIKFINVSRFAPKKGIEFTLKAFKIAKDRGLNAEINFIGSGPLLNKMKKLTDDLGINDDIKFTGSLNSDKIPELMRNADVFLLHSITAGNDAEGLPTVVVEAMSSGLPVISTYHQGIPEAVIDGKSGYLIEERNVEKYAEKMLMISKDNLLRQEMGLFNRKRVETEFNSDIQNNELKKIYNEVINNHETQK